MPDNDHALMPHLAQRSHLLASETIIHEALQLLQRLSKRQHLAAAGKQLLIAFQPTIHEHLPQILCNECLVVRLIEI